MFVVAPANALYKTCLDIICTGTLYYYVWKLAMHVRSQTAYNLVPSYRIMT